MKPAGPRAVVPAVVAASALAGLAAVSRRVSLDGKPAALRSADAILVFGASVWPAGPSLTLRVRVARAAEVYAEGFAPTVVCSGGWSGGESEAGVMRELLAQLGVPRAAVVPDDGGVTTREALRSACRFGFRSVIAVSSPYHLHRILCEARRQRLEVVPCPAFRPGPRTPRLAVYDLRQHLREVMAVPSYAVTARLEAALSRGAGRIVRASGVELAARLRALAGEADAVAAADAEIAELLKRARPELSDVDGVVTPYAARLAWPAEGAVTSGFGLRYRRLHAGVDFSSSYGDPVLAAGAGRVVLAARLGPYGDVTVLDHGGGLATVYAHQAGLLVREGDYVAPGQAIGLVGETGKSFGPHLHFEVRVHGTAVDPLVYLTATADGRQPSPRGKDAPAGYASPIA